MPKYTSVFNFGVKPVIFELIVAISRFFWQKGDSAADVVAGSLSVNSPAKVVKFSHILQKAGFSSLFEGLNFKGTLIS